MLDITRCVTDELAVDNGDLFIILTKETQCATIMIGTVAFEDNIRNSHSFRRIVKGRAQLVINRPSVRIIFIPYGIHVELAVFDRNGIGFIDVEGTTASE